MRDCRLLFEQLESSLSSSWDHYFAQARIYYAEHGDLRVPLRYKTPGGLSLGDWVQTQRRLRRGKYQFGVLTQQQIDKLNSIGKPGVTISNMEICKYRRDIKTIQVLLWATGSITPGFVTAAVG